MDAMILSLVVATGMSMAAPADARAPSKPMKAVTGLPAAADRFNPAAVVCKAVSIPGSRLQQQRVCKTRSEWDQITRIHREAAEKERLRSISPFLEERMGALR